MSDRTALDYVEQLERELTRSNAAFCEMVMANGRTAERNLRYAVALREISALGRTHPDPYIEGSCFADIADRALGSPAQNSEKQP